MMCFGEPSPSQDTDNQARRASIGGECPTAGQREEERESAGTTERRERTREQPRERERERERKRQRERERERERERVCVYVIERREINHGALSTGGPMGKRAAAGEAPRAHRHCAAIKVDADWQDCRGREAGRFAASSLPTAFSKYQVSRRCFWNKSRLDFAHVPPSASNHCWAGRILKAKHVHVASPSQDYARETILEGTVLQHFRVLCPCAGLETASLGMTEDLASFVVSHMCKRVHSCWVLCWPR